MSLRDKKRQRSAIRPSGNLRRQKIAGLAVLIVFILLCLPLGGYSQQTHSSRLPSDSPEGIYEFAEENYKNGDYQAAAIEFKRFVYFFKDHRRAPEAAYKAGMSYFHMPRYDKAIDEFKRAAQISESPDQAARAMFMISRCHTRLNNPADALYILNRIVSETKDPQIRDQAYYRIGRLRLEKGNVRAAKKAFSAISPKNRKYFKVSQLLRRLEDSDEISTRSPFLAGLFSIVPGGGYLYCGRYREAATAFIITAGLAVASWESFDEDLNAVGAITGIAGAGFYGGNVIGSISSAHKYNQKSYREYIRRLPLKDNFPLSLGVEHDNVMISFGFRF